jgi:Na+-driven multidrug efflux pump
MGQAVRALGDAWVAIWIYAAAFIVLLIPLGWAALNLWGFDERALLGSIVVACLLATVLLSWRFRVLTRMRTP